MSLSLSEYNMKNRNGKRIIKSGCIIRKREKMLQVCLNSEGCRFRKSGSCVMCDYGEGRSLSQTDIYDVISEISLNLENVDSILLGSLGSVLDPSEIKPEYLEQIFDFLSKQSVPVVILETHYTTIQENTVKWIRKCMPKKDIVVEVGLESVDPFVQKNCLNKVVNLDVLKDKIALLHKYQISVTANVFLGAPFLSEQEQIADAHKSVLWAIENQVDSVTIFPANIRKNTLLESLYLSGQYRRISQWDVYELLDRIPVGYLDRIYLAWYGDWIDIDESGNVINLPPWSCERCTDQWMKFYHKFLNIRDGIGRKRFLQQYKKVLQKYCKCYNIVKNSDNNSWFACEETINYEKT